ncbi:MAG: ATP-binding protein [Myxococcota bacterium]
MATPQDKAWAAYSKYRREVADHQIVPALGAGILIVIGLHLPFLLLDYSYYGENFVPLAIGRISNAVSLGLLFLFAKSWPAPVMVLAVANAGLHLIGIIGFAGGVSSLYFPGLMLLFLGVPVLLPMTSMQAGLVVGFLFACFAGLPLAGFGEFGTQEYIVNLFFPGAAGIECIFSCALLERLRFRDYQRREEIAAARDQLAKLDDAKNRFSANVHHELRTPLTLMIEPLDSLRAGEYGAISDQAKDMLGVMAANGQRLLKLINDLLDLAKLEDKKFNLDRQPIALVSFIDELVRGTEALALKKDLRVEKRADIDPSLRVVADRDALDKILINLVGNAMKFTNPGGRITLACESVEGGVQITVADTGIGLEEDQLVRIFDRFSQVDSSATRKHEGTGIGLSLVSELVQLHQGRIWATSEGLGRGTTMHAFLPNVEPDTPKPAENVVVTLPEDAAVVMPTEANSGKDGARRGSPIQVDRFIEIGVTVERWADQNAKSDDRHECRATPSNRRRPRVLVTDDNRDMRELLRFVLEKEFEVETAKNGLEALERVAADPPALVVTDLMMPGLSGTELCERIKTTDSLRDIPVMIVSSKAEGEMKVKGLELGADDYVTKPFHPREVMARARALIRLREAQREVAQRNAELQGALDRLSRTQTQLIQSERLAAVGELAAGIAHEVNNPVNYALNAARALKSITAELQEVAERFDRLHVEDGEQMVAYVKALRAHLDELDMPEVVRSIDDIVRIISDGLERTKKLVGDLRDYAMPHKSQEHERLDIAAGIESTLRLVSREISADGIELVRNGPLEGVYVNGDIGALNQVVLNLLRNAHQAIRDSPREGRGERPWIGVSLVVEGSMIAVRVSDNGPGIPEHILGRIFEPFFTTKDPGKGSGLGLSMCRGIVESHGGRLEVQTEVGQGSTFSILLHASQGQGAEAQ